MTRKDYKLLAKAVAQADLCPMCFDAIVIELGKALEADNPRFSWENGSLLTRRKKGGQDGQ